MNKLHTPWGAAHAVYAYHPQRKIFQVHTASHGGFAVALDLPMPEALAQLGEVMDEHRWFEEDIAWAAVPVAFPTHFCAERQQSARDLLRDEFPDAYSAHFGVTLTAVDSAALARRAWEAATSDSFVVLAGYSDQHWNVPEGHVYVCGFRKRDEATRGCLVPAAVYEVHPARLVLDEFPSWEPDRSRSFLKAGAAV